MYEIWCLRFDFEKWHRILAMHDIWHLTTYIKWRRASWDFTCDPLRIGSWRTWVEKMPVEQNGEKKPVGMIKIKTQHHSALDGDISHINLYRILFIKIWHVNEISQGYCYQESWSNLKKLQVKFPNLILPHVPLNPQFCFVTALKWLDFFLQRFLVCFDVTMARSLVDSLYGRLERVLVRACSACGVWNWWIQMGQCMLSFNRWVGVSVFARFRMNYIFYL